MVTPIRPSDAAFRIRSRGYFPVSSIARAWLATSSRANAATPSRNAACSLVSSRFIGGCSARLGEPFEHRPEPVRRDRQLLRQDARLADNGHEVGVTVPARDDVEVQMLENAGA